MKWLPQQLKTGDMMRIKTAIVHHYGIYVSDGEVIQFGLPPVSLLNRDEKSIKVITTDMQTFACGQIPEVAVPETPAEKQRLTPEQTVQRARERLGQGGYSLLHNNCEHFAYDCVYGKPYSSQEEFLRNRWRTRPVLDVYVCQVPNQVAIEEVYPPERQLLIEQTKAAALKRQRYVAWQTLAVGVKRSFSLTMQALAPKKNDNGKWEGSGAYFSLSHTDGYVAVAVSNQAVGVDIELPARAKKLPLSSLAQKVLTEEELANFSGDENELLRYWTQKESIFKVKDKKTFIPNQIITKEEKVFTCRLPQWENLTLSVSGANLANIRLYTVAEGMVNPLVKEQYECL